MINIMVHAIRLASMAALALCAGCTTTFSADTKFPAPVVETLPLSVGIYYDEEFRTYWHRGTNLQGDKWAVELGPANVAVFDRLFSVMFAEVAGVTEPESWDTPLKRTDAVIAPELESYRVALPGDFDDRRYTVWIEYRVRVLAPDGVVIANWLIDAYGQSMPRGVRHEKSMREATRLAMRDAAATVATEFKHQPDIRNWLREYSHPVQATAQAALLDGDVLR